MSPSKIQATEYPISKVFSNDFVFTIPLYQRPYAWYFTRLKSALIGRSHKIIVEWRVRSRQSVSNIFVKKIMKLMVSTL